MLNMLEFSFISCVNFPVIFEIFLLCLNPWFPVMQLYCITGK